MIDENLYSSILRTIRELIVHDVNDPTFDVEIIVHLNTALSRLYELGVTKSAFKVTGESETWADLLGDATKFEDVKTYLYIRVKIVFDPPSSSYVLTNLKEERDRLEWLLNVKAEEVDEDG